MEAIVMVINENWRWVGPVLLVAAGIGAVWTVLDLFDALPEDEEG